MSENIQFAVARLRRQVPTAEHRIDDALIAVSTLMTSVVTARRDTLGVPAIRGHATIQRLARVQSALVGASGDVLRVHGDLADIAQETAGLDLHECPALAAPSADRSKAAA
ncbi:hypothetical protein CDQ92_08305 [Sphingopyxis bauzanensis]|uniref:Uncharacterized protein n=1 Tax=Sphingopyxis bauzanensis TaxID=651663 RepID=A0A246JWY7_9SPHN|nr:hypothetical protein [Sphingopyxis bauzanensis]OWQ97072.1 hypothetical protein CDQ92_08305 [Sphingopyxis bauzanensis]GGJ41182.1 hypothetical protein GCM10011393_09260 [Sphingopyxis bauzanensis]